MLFSRVLGQEHIKKHLLASVKNNRIPHTQLFVGPEGSGTLLTAVAYAQEVLCHFAPDEATKEATKKKVENFTHPDLHFAYPVAKNAQAKKNNVKHIVSDYYAEEWREFLTTQPYGNLFDWYQLIGVENAQGLISVHEANDINKKLSLKAYEGGYKVMIIWMAEKMNAEASNKLLKLLEEPPHKTLFILIAEDEELLLQTIRSRCQILHFHPVAEEVIKDCLINVHNASPATAALIAHQANGNFNKALDLLHNDSEDLVFEQWFVWWVRSAFKAKGNKAAIHDILSWSEEVAKTGRETQKKFLHFCLEAFRQAMLLNYKAKDLVFLAITAEDFKFDKFAPFVHERNIVSITKEIETAIYHIERNANAKLVLTDLSIKLARLLHKKAA